MITDTEFSGRIVYMGSGPFGAEALKVIGGHLLPAGIVTQPDRAAGRGRRLERGAVARWGDEHGVRVLQPEGFREPAAIQELAAESIDILIVASYGRLLPATVLALPHQGCLNLHPSLLPRHRGPSPIPAAILAGDSETGVTVMEMVMRMDAGPIVAQRSLPIGPEDTTESLTPMLARANAQLLVDVLPEWTRGHVSPRSQDETRATFSRMITKEDGLLDWTKSSADLDREVRAYNPWPVAYTYWGGVRLRIFRSRPVDQTDAARSRPGQVLGCGPDGLLIQTGTGSLIINELQPEGGRRMPASAFAAGHPGISTAELQGPSR